MYCTPNVISLGSVPVSKKHLFTLSLFVILVILSHCRDNAGRLSGELSPALAMTEGSGGREDLRIPLHASGK